MADRQDQNPPQEPQAHEASDRQTPSTVEWLVGGAATLLVLSGIGFLVYEAFQGTDSPPLIDVVVRRVVPQPTGGYLVEVAAANRGGSTARGLVIKGELLLQGQDDSGGGNTEGTKAIETATATLAWVPAHAERQGGLFFKYDPRQYRLEVAPQGYDRP